MASKRINLVTAGIAGWALVLSVLWLLQGPAQPARAADYCVSSYASIQQAIGAAGNGDTVRVPTGLYTETLEITQSITLQGGWNSGCSVLLTKNPAQTVIDGGGAGSVVRIVSASPTLEAVTIQGGQSDYGAGVYSWYSSPTLAGVIVTGNTLSDTAFETAGAGIYQYFGTLTLGSTQIVGNTPDSHPSSAAFGGGIYIGYGGGVIMTATEVVSNIGDLADDVRGGGIFINSGSTIDLRGTENVIAYNVATYGGGIYMSGNTDLIGALVVHNYANGYGGGVAIYPGEGGVFANNVITGNGAYNRGSGIVLINAAVEVANNTFFDNGGNAGTGIEIGDTGTRVVTITNNVVVSHVVGIRNLHATVSPTLVTNDVWSNGTNYVGLAAGASDLHVDPLFVAPASGDYHLAVGSPLINAGSPVPWLSFDFEGDDREYDCDTDIGADEFTAERYCYPVYLPLLLRSF
jgi:hypothetical protein